jgi:hypothetical protein
MIQKYTKKPVTIEAIQFKEETIPTIKEWLGDNLLAEARYSSPIHWIYRIKTLEGNMLVTEGDFIIKGVKGEFYPCKPDIFYATYDGPVKVLWDHTTGEYDSEYKKRDSTTIEDIRAIQKEIEENERQIRELEEKRFNTIVNKLK